MKRKQQTDLRALILLLAFLACIVGVNQAIAGGGGGPFGKDNGDLEERLKEQNARILFNKQQQEKTQNNNSPSP